MRFSDETLESCRCHVQGGTLSFLKQTDQYTMCNMTSKQQSSILEDFKLNRQKVEPWTCCTNQASDVTQRGRRSHLLPLRTEQCAPVISLTRSTRSSLSVAITAAALDTHAMKVKLYEWLKLVMMSARTHPNAVTTLTHGTQ